MFWTIVGALVVGYIIIRLLDSIIKLISLYLAESRLTLWEGCIIPVFFFIVIISVIVGGFLFFVYHYGLQDVVITIAILSIIAGGVYFIERKSRKSSPPPSENQGVTKKENKNTKEKKGLQIRMKSSTFKTILAIIIALAILVPIIILVW